MMSLLKYDFWFLQHWLCSYVKPVAINVIFKVLN